MIQQQSIVPATGSSVVVSSIEEIPATDDDDDLFVEDETTLERIIALKEMFPETIRNTLGTINSTLLNTSKLAYDKGRSAAWCPKRSIKNTSGGMSKCIDSYGL
ncbi:unnamed protein product [Rotaria magnacalcarata]|uniref:Mitochondrial import receptor subunit TOM22 homolog n=1 Tax=Rotaria magnacalcarata TaxID=392030 RepID=A0A8S3CNV2_9BILA|nr:unnamed protein product [Rotaria magnacalcarata]